MFQSVEPVRRALKGLQTFCSSYEQSRKIDAIMAVFLDLGNVGRGDIGLVFWNVCGIQVYNIIMQGVGCRHQ